MNAFFSSGIPTVLIVNHLQITVILIGSWPKVWSQPTNLNTGITVIISPTIFGFSTKQGLKILLASEHLFTDYNFLFSCVELSA